MRKIIALPGALARLALPQSCALCAAASGNALVCGACAAAMPRISEACPRCALPSPRRSTCGQCLVHVPPYASTLAAFAYAFPADRLLQRLKYGSALALADWAAASWIDALAQTRTHSSVQMPDVIVPVPLTATRQRERGFNQAREIARGIARRLDASTGSLLERVRDAPPQAALPWSGRAANVHHAFRCRQRLDGTRVALVDDVMTTGATLSEAARTLLAAGADSVALWVIARTLPPQRA